MRLTAVLWLLPMLIGLVPLAAQAQDEPDPYFIDANSDGIDGVLANAVFVAPPPTGVNGAGRGLTPADPVATITFGISRALATGRSQVLVQVGTYPETITVSSGISIFGGYDSSFVRVPSNAANATVISGGTTAVLIQSVNVPTTLAFLTIRSANQSTQGESAYAVRVINSSGLTMRYNRFEPGNGGSGVDAGNGSPGSGTVTQAQQGQNAETVATGGIKIGGAGGTSACNRTGGQGGNGGGGSTLSAQSGQSGSGGATGGPAGPNSNTVNVDGANGGFGGHGTDGSDGVHGAATNANVLGTVNASAMYFPPTAATAAGGSHGHSGAGGGGGGGQDCAFGCDRDVGASGGGGGAGACAGGGADGGGGGGGSFGVTVAGSALTLSPNLFRPGLGGGGGDGGDGGQGGIGGPGMDGGLQLSTDGGFGGRGGDGGDAGDGGSGAGGNGGPSIGVMDLAGVNLLTGNRYIQAASAAPAGLNGFGNSASPAPGLRRFAFPNTIATLGLPAVSVADVIAGEPATGSANALFNVTLNAVHEEIVTINYSFTTVGGATAGVDFDATTGSVTFNPWTTTATIAVPILADAETEAPEQFELVLAPPPGLGNYTVGDGTGVATIVPDKVFGDGFE